MNIFLYFFVFSFINTKIFCFRSSYNYYLNGEDWEGECAFGEEQSPVDIDTRFLVRNDPNLFFDIQWDTSNLTAKTKNYGVTFKSYGNWSTLKASDYEGRTHTYDSQQFHFHSPSEHTINGNFFDLEMHIVHILRSDSHKENPKRIAAVVGIFFNIDEEDNENPFFDEYNPLSPEEFNLNISALLGEQFAIPLEYFTYSGSLTTPPCSEIVNWYLLAKPLNLSSKQLKRFTDSWSSNETFAHGKGNNRKIRPLNGRQIKYGGEQKNNEKDINLLSILAFLVLFCFIIIWFIKLSIDKKKSFSLKNYVFDCKMCDINMSEAIE